MRKSVRDVSGAGWQSNEIPKLTSPFFALVISRNGRNGNVEREIKKLQLRKFLNSELSGIYFDCDAFRNSLQWTTLYDKRQENI